MPVTMLGADYRYSLSPYARMGQDVNYDAANIPSDYDWSKDPQNLVGGISSEGFDWTKIGTAIGQGLPAVTDFIRTLQGKPTTSAADSAKLELLLKAIASGKFTSADAQKKSLSDYLPWIIGGGAVVIALLFIVGTRR